SRRRTQPGSMLSTWACRTRSTAAPTRESRATPSLSTTASGGSSPGTTRTASRGRAARAIWPATRCTARDSSCPGGPLMSADLRLTEADALRLREHCKPSFRAGRCPETGIIGILGECRAGGKHEFLLVKLFPPGPGDLKVAGPDQLVFDASYIRRAHLEMR